MKVAIEESIEYAESILLTWLLLNKISNPHTSTDAKYVIKKILTDDVVKTNDK